MSQITADDFNAVMDDIGSYVDRRVGSISFSFGESTTTWTTGSTLAVVQSISETDDVVRQGIMNTGDLRVFTKGTNTDLDTTSSGKDEVQVGWEGEWYQRDGHPMVLKVGSYVNHKEYMFKRIGVSE